MIIMSEKELTTKSRNDLPDSDFALPKDRKYPIPDESHARNALARVAANGTDAEKKAVRAAVHKKFPGIEIGESVLRESDPFSILPKIGQPRPSYSKHGGRDEDHSRL